MGIGFGIAYRLAEAGASVLIADLNEVAAVAADGKLKEKGWKATSVGADVSKKDDVAKMVQAAVSSFGGVDILVNNAGIYPETPILKMTEEDFMKVLAVNLKSVFLCTQAAAEKMIMQGRGGRIINITSIDALHPSSVGLAHYDASKSGVWGFTKNAALELAPHKIWVNAIAPGGIATPGTGALSSGVAKEMLDAFIAKIPMKRMGEPDDIGKAALFLASEFSSYMTGTQIVVDGGVLLA